MVDRAKKWEAISTAIAERQETGRRHREEMHQHHLQQVRTYQRERYKRTRDAESIALIRRAEMLKQARAAATGTLSELVAEQERDEKYGHSTGRRRWLLSLDENRESLVDVDNPKAAWTLYDVIASEVAA